MPAPADVADRDAVTAMVQGVEDTVGTVDVLVVNHAYMTMGPLTDHDPDDWWSEAGLISLAKSLGRELAPRGVIVNAVAPGVVDTPQLEVDARAAGVTRDRIIEQYTESIPLRRVGRPEEIAAAVALLVDPRTSALVGQVLQVNGGSTRTRA